ncbi:cytochrome c oxidase subunit 3 [Marinimicrobium alkaliphilum]|uniref:cytochrome c oxidase subunit 3 n=1 Tax=Marinimicrobium alkaliphilum TaxID=2202654 RepID=UPI000DBA1081|nr:cytochrome c oxidase subunit 3 [Marinimicrobium alkaliphilum]
MSLIAKLTEKSWEPAHTGVMHAGPGQPQTSKKIALGIFMVIISVLFTLFFLTFITHSQYPGFQALAAEPWSPFYNTGRLWMNTALLVGASVAIHAALISARRGAQGPTLIALVITLFFSAQFVIAQIWLWRHLTGMGYGFTTNPANSYFYLLSAIHALHLLGGVAVLVRATWLNWQGTALARSAQSIKLCASYWHYLLALWLVLFALMTASPETYNTIAALCGLEVDL